MEAAVFRRIGVRFVPRIDDRSLDHRIEIDQTFEKIRALRKLIGGRVTVIFGADLSRPGIDLPGDKEGNQQPDDRSKGTDRSRR